MLYFLFLLTVFAEQCVNGNCKKEEENLYPINGVTVEIADCLRTSLDLTESFTNLISECPQSPKKMFPLNITQSNIRQILASNSYFIFDSNETTIGKMDIKGDIAMVIKNAKINVIDAFEGDTNLTIPKCKEACTLQVDQSSFNSLNDFYIGNKVTINSKSMELNCSKEYQSSIHIGAHSHIKSDKMNISGFTIIFTEGHKKVNMSGPLIVADEFSTNRPLSIQVIDHLHPQQCIIAIKSPSLKKYPKTMQFKIDTSYLNFVVLPVKTGNITEVFSPEKKVLIFTEENINKMEIPKGYEKKTYEGSYIVLPLQSGIEIFPIEDLDQDFIINRTILRSEEPNQEVSSMYLMRINDQNQVKLDFKNPKKYLIEGKEHGKKHKTKVYQVNYSLNELNVSDNNLIYLQEFKKKNDIVFPIEGGEIMAIPNHYFRKGNKYPLKNYEVWSMDDEEYFVFNKFTILNMFSFFTDVDYKLTRVDDQLLICHPQIIPKEINVTQVNQTQVNEQVNSTTIRSDEENKEIKEQDEITNKTSNNEKQ
ncbi:hypothetical protein KM1_276200 [Entamoeba histolytica HM-3:IMSS]|uniref:Uncharacterized protein n=4 Tax=Entamoeba histolytica TaxID=5759 RepID=C4M400_ENTH1|nr:hypothetical protein EHI_194850 [Entamoeba histolytica HM-1:IMSS]EAL48468.1 hypothetical protein EHI_194850 [Entamoeba histolytica HM-1:IMSS]EMD44604.1 Hypothetical protein EHI5A_219270 [Entamoeba histolytica KU27]EMS11407.1 hypothetical protein KM1_276200 [Entamoeba histolytica HM-3:IMSS]GAT96068.1 hypothetical protein CL6EHI_194850 [Entamoeba histolytica]|eukprot:XP_653854.1 hypothetical protein EHI_194850 [Entamoeba histolytica HM-1:IMSS]